MTKQTTKSRERPLKSAIWNLVARMDHLEREVGLLGLSEKIAQAFRRTAALEADVDELKARKGR